MKKRISSRAIIIEDNKLLVFYRKKKKENGDIIEYYSLPGGGLEENETLEENVIRELKEEFSVDIKVLGYVGKRETTDMIEHFFACKIINGIPKLGGEELERNCDNNYYEITKLDINNLNNYDIRGIEFIQKANSKEYIK